METHLSPWEVAAAEVRLSPWYLVKHPVTWVFPLVVFAFGGLVMFLFYVFGASVQDYYFLGGVSLVVAVDGFYRSASIQLFNDRYLARLGVWMEAVPAAFKDTILRQMASYGMSDTFDALEQRHGEHPAREEVLGQLGAAMLIWHLDADIVGAIWRRWIDDPTDPDGIPHRCERCYGRVILPPQCCPEGVHEIIRYYAGPCVTGDTTEVQHGFETTRRQQQLAAYL